MAIEAMDCTLSGAMREQDKPVTMAKKATASVLIIHASSTATQLMGPPAPTTPPLTGTEAPLPGANSSVQTSMLSRFTDTARRIAKKLRQVAKAAANGMTTIAGKALSAYLWMGHRLLKGLLSPIFLALAWCDVWKGHPKQQYTSCRQYQAKARRHEPKEATVAEDPVGSPTAQPSTPTSVPAQPSDSLAVTPGGRKLLSHPLADLARDEDDEGCDISSIALPEIAAEDLPREAGVSVTTTAAAPRSPPSPHADSVVLQVAKADAAVIATTTRMDQTAADDITRAGGMECLPVEPPSAHVQTSTLDTTEVITSEEIRKEATGAAHCPGDTTAQFNPVGSAASHTAVPATGSHAATADEPSHNDVPSASPPAEPSVEVPPLTLPAIVSVVAPCAAATEFVSDASYPGAPASKATGGVSAPVQSAGADVPSAADLGATRKAKKKEKKLRQKAGRQAQQQAEKETNEKKFAIDPEDPAINDKASIDAGKKQGADTGTKLGADKETPGKCVESASLGKTAKGVSAPNAGVPAPAKQDAKQKSGKEPTADSFVNPTHTACSAAIVESGASTGMASKDATQSAPSPHPAMLAEDPAAPSKQARMRAKKTKESQVHSPMNLPGSKCTAAGVETGTAPGKAQDGPSGAKASQGARAAGAGANAAPVSSQKEARTPKAPSTKPAVKDARMATKGSGTPVKETGTDRPRGAPPAGKSAGLAAQSRGATRKDAVSPALSAKVPGANLSKSAQKRVRKKEAAAISSIGGNAGQFAAAAYNNALIYARDGGPFGRAQVSHIDGLLRTLKLERRQVKADGNCFMACVALGLLDPASPWPDSDALSEAGAALRAVAVEFLKDWLQRHPADAKIYEDDQICDGKYTEEERPQIWQDYAAEMLQPGKPAHDFFMSMATAAHNVHMVLVQNGDGDSIRLRHFPEPPEEQLRLLQLQECGAHVPTVITALYSWSPTVWHHEIAAPLGATHVRDALSLQLPDEFTLKHCYYQHQSDESRSAAVRRQEKEAEQAVKDEASHAAASASAQSAGAAPHLTIYPAEATTPSSGVPAAHTGPSGPEMATAPFPASPKPAPAAGAASACSTAGAASAASRKATASATAGGSRPPCKAAKQEHRIAASRAIHSVAPASRRPSGAWEKPVVTSVPSKDTTVAQHPQSAQASLPSAAPRSRKAARAASAAANRSSSQPGKYSSFAPKATGSCCMQEKTATPALYTVAGGTRVDFRSAVLGLKGSA